MNVFQFLRKMGPAWIVSAVACGPATMASVARASGQFGYEIIWVVVLSALLAFTAQYMAAKAGILSGKGIIATVEERWGRGLAWLLTIDALLATWLAAAVLMKALAGTMALVFGLESPLWSVLYAAVLFWLIGYGGYRALERVCKILVALVVACFAVTVLVVRPDVPAMLSGLVPTLPGGAQGALMMAGIMGGAVHITIIAMHTYNVNSRGWTRNDLGFARTDTFLSMFVAFGFYSLAIALAAAVTLHPEQLSVRTAFDLAKTLSPVLGPWANAVFLAGLVGAVISTISPTFLAGGYFLADKLGIELSVRDSRFRMLVLAGCVISLAGPLIPGSFVTMLVVMLALGLCGTPFILVLLMLLLNRRDWAGEHVNGLGLNILGSVTVLVTTFLALRFLAAKLGFWG